MNIKLQFSPVMKFYYKARMQEMKEKELRYTGTGDANSHVCKVCFESPSAAMLLPCRHYASHVPLRVLNVLFAERRS
ncbi:hypothetical protein OROGR_020111 [Orobanche gracilis]